eukprot:CAMPEP_0194362222 /NCGR_PEP_ID=MMETSP0174-20130528/9941_1 /TAXON_ID=216777 /ORGANISM="Proboscia alata, Strain PI-D3" /LENGTH=120 /DNA_ID=CAMNT_0039134947 /DNA_START=52 /DNA_END=414 /DNA_ORIENTATION=-
MERTGKNKDDQSTGSEETKETKETRDPKESKKGDTNLEIIARSSGMHKGGEQNGNTTNELESNQIRKPIPPSIHSRTIYDQAHMQSIDQQQMQGSTIGVFACEESCGNGGKEVAATETTT